MGTLFLIQYAVLRDINTIIKNGDWENSIQPLTNRICREHGLSVLELEEVKEKRKTKGTGRKISF